jgi:hypothetical protein
MRRCQKNTLKKYRTSSSGLGKGLNEIETSWEGLKSKALFCLNLIGTGEKYWNSIGKIRTGEQPHTFKEEAAPLICIRIYVRL